MKKSTIILTGILLITMISGCTRAIREGMGVAKGGKGLYVFMPGGVHSTPGSLAGEYEAVKLAPFTNASGTQPPANLNQLLEMEFRKFLNEKPLPLTYAGPGRTIVITGQYIYYEKAEKTGHIFGPFEEVIAIVELRDQNSGTLLAKANCVGRTDTSVNIGDKHKAEGLAKAIYDLIKELVLIPEQK